jgi:hypothetical protein
MDGQQGGEAVDDRCQALAVLVTVRNEILVRVVDKRKGDPANTH